VALIDLGSNAARFLLARIQPRGFAIVDEQRAPTRLGGARDGRLPARAVRETLRAVDAFLDLARRHKATRVIALATAAVRDADNADTLLEPLRQRHRLDLRILSGEEEARLGARAVLATLPIDRSVVIDLGGGSLQITPIRHGEPMTAASLPLGTARTTARFLRHDPPTTLELSALRGEVRRLVDGVLPPAAEGGVLVGLGGTIRTLARIQRATGRGAKRIHAARLARTAVVAIRERLESMPLRRRRSVEGLKAERADIIVAGAVIVEELMDLGGYTHLLVCAQGVRHGMLAEEASGTVTA
jgi:exopolyphosphatase/guanosine-5'-triphosphate,3'-diphosphate pyrophosphatase